jgi:RecB family endonuclease NucS
MIDPAEPFILQATCRVIYDGRAYSTLETGNYLVLHKADGSLQIHGAKLIKPLNYQGPKSSLEYNQGVLRSINKKEAISIEIDEIISYSPLSLSDNQIQIKRTEKELVAKILRNWESHFFDQFELVETEVQSEVGAVDLLGITTSSKHYVVEVKRKKASLKDCSQLKRYVEHFAQENETLGILASPTITENALKYLVKHNMQYLEINFDE